MTSQVFYRKWRPQTLAEVVGQEHVTQTLRNALESGRVAHAYPFCGPRGTGKTSTGRILAKAVNCLEGGRGEPCNACSMCQAITEGRALDMIEIDAASNRGIDEIRDLREKVNFAPNLARYKVYIIDEAHMLTKEASNALLKTLEEPPSYVIFVLATTEPHKMLSTILSRCQRFDFRRLSLSAAVSKLTIICSSEGIHADPEALRLIARSATGSLRDAENLLEQLVAYYGSEIGIHQVRAILGITGDWRAKELAKHILHRDVAAGLKTINSVSSDGLDLRQFNRELVEYLRGLLLVKSGSEGTVDVTVEELEEMREVVAAVSLDHILKAVKLFGETGLRMDDYSPLPVELALVECLLPLEGEPSVEEVAIPAEVAVHSHEAQPSMKVAEPLREVTSPVTGVASSVAEADLSMTEEHPHDLEHVRAHWGEFVKTLRGMGSSGNLDAFLRSACSPIDIDGDTLVLGFYHSFHRDRIDDPKYRHLVEKKLGEKFGTPNQIRCVLNPREKKVSEGHLAKEAMKIGARIIDVEEK